MRSQICLCISSHLQHPLRDDGALEAFHHESPISLHTHTHTYTHTHTQHPEVVWGWWELSTTAQSASRSHVWNSVSLRQPTCETLCLVHFQKGIVQKVATHCLDS